MGAARFEFRYDRWCGRLLGALGLGRRRSRIEVTDQALVVRMGWAFSTEVPRSQIASAAATDRRVYGWGVHGWRGRWLVNGSSHDLVTLTIDPASRARVCGVPINLRELCVSVVEPAALVRSVGSSELPS